MFFSQYESPVGPLTLRADGAALTGLAFGSCAEPPSSLPLFDEAFAWLDAYFSGRDPAPRRPCILRAQTSSGGCGGSF